jgi:CO dehydrogenase/acetyl-CoA synthase alpha subunit
MKLPSFFIDASDAIKYEETIDFYMSWTIRCADLKHQQTNKKVYDAARRILAKLVQINYADGLLFSNIQVWKQHQHIDLWVELMVHDKAYTLIIENKMYSEIHSNQLNRYQKLAEKHYKDDPERIIKYALLKPDYELNEQDKKLKIVSDFHYFRLEELADSLEKIKTGNHLFDEFWFNWAEDSKIKREL